MTTLQTPSEDTSAKWPKPLNIYGPAEDYLSCFPATYGRFLLRVTRRDGEQGCFESLENLAKGCKIDPDTARAAKKTFIARNVLSLERIDGVGDILRVRPFEDWTPIDQHPQENTGGVPIPTGRKIREGSGRKAREGYPSENTGDKGNKVKASKKKTKSDLISSLLATKSEEFKAAWREWMVARNSLKPKLTPEQFARQLSKLADWTDAEVIDAINNSIRNAWKGLFKPDVPAKAKHDGGYTRLESLDRPRTVYKDL